MGGVGDSYYRRFLDQWRHKLQKYRFSAAGHRRSSSPFSSDEMATRGHVAEIEGFDSSRVRNFPFSSFKLLGAMQIGIGVTVLLLGVIDLFLYLYVTDDHDDTTLSALTIASVPIWCGLWFVVSGFMGTCMSLNQKTTLAFFKLTFLVLSVCCALLFAPVLCGIEIFIVTRRTENSHKAYEWLIPLLIAFFAFNELICAVITASICCCCSPLNQAKKKNLSDKHFGSQVRVLYTRSIGDHLEPPEEKRRLSSPEIFFTDHSHRRNTRDEKALVLHKSAHNPRRNVMTVDENTEFDEPITHPVPPHTTREPRAVMTAGSPTFTHYSRPTTNDENHYRRLKQLMVPGDPEAY